MNVIIRKIRESEYHRTEQLTRKAFWNLYNPGSEEHLVLHNLRKSDGYIADLDLVATYKNEIIGHLIGTKAIIRDSRESDHEVLCVGPVSVLPEYQNQGIGSRLMEESISIAAKLGFAGMILFGDPSYYHRFGFRNAAEYGIRTNEDQNFDAFMALELQKGGFKNIHGRFYADDAFEVDTAELEEFDKHFPPRIKGKPKKPVH